MKLFIQCGVLRGFTTFFILFMDFFNVVEDWRLMCTEMSKRKEALKPKAEDSARRSCRLFEVILFHLLLTIFDETKEDILLNPRESFSFLSFLLCSFILFMYEIGYNYDFFLDLCVIKKYPIKWAYFSLLILHCE
jgi:hypothetical protein